MGRTLAQHVKSPGFNPQHCTNQALWYRFIIPGSSKRIKSSRLGGEMAQQVKAFAAYPDDLRSPQ